MEISVREITCNKEMLNRCRRTVWKDALDKEPSEKFVSDLYFSEHSPIRDKWFVIEICGIKSWIATHLCRHSIGFTPYISSQRDDRHASETKRDDLPQGALVNMDITLNAQSFINVSRKRLCMQSHKETVAVWKSVIDKLRIVDAPLAGQCVPNCVYRGGICPEGGKSCKFNKTDAFIGILKGYCENHENSYRNILFNESE